LEQGSAEAKEEAASSGEEESEGSEEDKGEEDEESSSCEEEAVQDMATGVSSRGDPVGFNTLCSTVCCVGGRVAYKQGSLHPLLHREVLQVVFLPQEAINCKL
jgi:hypothetical protein